MYRTRGFICFRKLFVPGVPAGYTAVGTTVDVQSRRNTIKEYHGFLLSSYLAALPSPSHNSTFLIPFNIIYFHMYPT